MSDASINPATGLPWGSTWTTDTAPASVPTAQNGYISLPATVDPYQLAADAFAFIAQQVPGWVPAEGHIVTWVVYAVARMVSTLAAQCSQVPDAIFEYFGASLVNLPPNPAAPAETTTTWTMTDSKGYTVPAGTVVGFATSGNSVVPFITTEAFTVAPGSTTATGITVQAQTAGAAANGLAAGDLVIVDQLAYVTAVTSTATTSGGADAETTAAYLNRLSQAFTLLSPRPVLAADFAVLAAQTAGVARALALDNFNPYANLLTAVDASFETGVGTAVAETNCAVTTSTTWAADGTHSLTMTATAAGSMTARVGPYPVSAGQTYSVTAEFHAGATAAPCALDIVWGDIDGTVLSTKAGTATNDSTSGGVQVTNSGTAPAGAAVMWLQPNVTAAAGGELHDADELGLYLGTNTTWGPGGEMSGQERTVTVVPVDANGQALTTDEMAAIQTALEASRETNFLVNVVAPTYTAISVTASVVVDTGSSLSGVQAAIEAALEAFLTPGMWAGGGQTPPVWLNDTVVRYLSVAGVIENVPGVHHIAPGGLTVNGGTADVVMAGYAPLPQLTMSVAVSAAPANT